MPVQHPVERRAEGRPSRWARAQKAVAALTLLAFAQGTLAGNLLRPSSGATAASSFAGASAGARTESLSSDAASAAARAAAAAQDASGPLRAALDAIRLHSGLQDAARQAAQAAASAVPNGLGVGGGLELAAGATAGSSLWTGAELPTDAAGTDGKHLVTVVQKDGRAILTWSTFNVGQQTELYFDQRAGGTGAAGWVALNRVNDPTAAPSQVLGSIKAEGQVYLLNRNGILFGGASQVAVGSLVASGLELAGASLEERNASFLKGGLLGHVGLTFGGDATVEGGAVTVEAGARLAAKAYGQVVLLGRQVSSAGTLTADDGQVVLAAGRDVLLSASLDKRGYKVQVNRGAEANQVSNAGPISAKRGNVTMEGSLIAQDGLVTATTSAEASGSILLGSSDPSDTLTQRQAITVTFGAGGRTQVLPDTDAGATVGTSAFVPSSVKVYGERIELLPGATVYAPGGAVELVTEVSSNLAGAADLTRVDLRAGSRVDVSGLRDVTVAMEQNSVKGELRSNELRDNPVLRTGPLRGQTVWFDARQAVEAADLTGYAGLVEKRVEQLMTAAGTVTIRGNEILAREGSLIDLSGGSLRYLDGYLRTSWLIDPTGRPVRIDLAQPGVAYTGVVGGGLDAHPRWSVTQAYASALGRTAATFEKGYQEGKAAGKLVIDTSPIPWFIPFKAGHDSVPAPDPAATGAIRILQGTIAASIVVGEHQRELPTGTTDPTLAWRQRPAGAILQIGRAGEVRFSDEAPTPLDPAFGSASTFAADDPRRYHLDLPAGWFDGKTFSNVAIASGYTDDGAANGSALATRNLAPGGKLLVGAGVVVDLGDGGSLSYSGKGVELAGTLRAPGGKVSLTALDLPYDTAATPEHLPSVHLASGALIDVAGRFTNDHLDGASPGRALAGGSVSLASPNVTLDPGSAIDVSGGARLDGAGSKLAFGAAGTITLAVDPPTRPAFDNVGRLTLGGELRGWSAAAGGSLSLVTTDEVHLGAALPSGAGDRTRLLTPAFFSQGGFSQFTVVGSQGVTVDAGTILQPHVETLVPTDAVTSARTGALLAGLSTREPPASLALQAPMSLTLSSVPRGYTVSAVDQLADVVLKEGSRLALPDGSTVRLVSDRLLEVLGKVEAPGGTIGLTATDPVPSVFRSRVHLGAEARLLAPGYQKSIPETARTGDKESVVAGGTVTLSAATQLDLDAGSVIDVRGVPGVASLEAGAGDAGRSPYTLLPVDGRAGAVTLSGAQGSVQASFHLDPGGTSGAGGALTVTGNPARTSVLAVRQLPGTPASGTLEISASALSTSGADDLELVALPDGATTFQPGNVVLLQDGVTLSSRRSLTLRSPFLQAEALPASSGLTGGAVTLRSAAVLLKGGTGVAGSATQATATGLTDLLVEGGTIDVRNGVWLGCNTPDCQAGGFKYATLRSSGDVRLSDQGLSGYTLGLFSPGALELEAAQVYVTSRRQLLQSSTSTLPRADADPGFLLQSGVSVTVTGNGAAAPVPLSFGERLTLRAPTIVQGGVVRAPQGQIRLEASGTVRLLAHSLTSTSLEDAIVPFGPVTSLGGFGGYDQAGLAPEKAVAITAPSAEVAPDAVLDVSGGGDLLAYRFAPGNRGSADVLTSSAGFAILPSLGAGPAPVGGTTALTDSRLKVGDAVYLEGVAGLAPGVYTLLPAHYALLPGGLLVKPLGGASATAQPATVRPDGAMVASGYLTVAGQPIRDAGYQPFQVMSQATFLTYSDLPTSSFNETAHALAAEAGLTVRTPVDGGAVTIAASALTLKGTGRFGAATGGLLGTLDVAADKIAVAPAGPARAGWLQLDPGDLTRFGAGSLLLGGRRTAGADGTTIAVSASEIAVDTGGAAWSGPEIILAATSAISVADGSVVSASGAAAAGAAPLLLSGDGALLRLSTGERVAVVRSGATGAGGDLTVGAAELGAAGALSLDGSRAVTLAPGATLTAPQVGLTTARLNLGDAPAGQPGTALGSALLARLAQADDLLLGASQAIHLYPGLSVGARATGGAAEVAAVTLDTPSIQSHLSAGQGASVTAAQLTLRNDGAASAAAAPGGKGTLALDVDRLVLGPGAVRLEGLSALQGSAGTIALRGEGTLALDGEFSLQTAGVVAAGGARTAVLAGGALTLGAGSGTAPAADGLGGMLTLEAERIRLDTAIRLPAGTLQATARSGAVELGAGAALDVSGRAVDLGGQVRFASGGTIVVAAAGDLSVASGATLDVSGSAQGGDAGRLALTARGQATVQGTLSGAATAGGAGGAFSLDAARLGDAAGFTALGQLASAGGFDGELSVRLRQQDLVLAAGEKLTAHAVTLRSDAGAVTIQGEIAAQGTAALPDGGRVRLTAGTGLTVVAGARIDASAGQAAAGGFDPASGSVELASTGGRVDLAPGSTIAVGGGRSGGGSLVVRAARQGADVAIDRLGAGVLGAREVVVRGVASTQATVLNAGLLDGLVRDAVAWQQGGAAVRARLVASGASSSLLAVAPGLVVSSAGDLSVQGDLSLGGRLGTDAPGYLELAAAGNLSVDGRLSDGFADATPAAALLTGRSSTLVLSAGGDLVLHPGALVRTGTGRLSLAAGRDLVLEADSTHAAAAAYTGGRSAGLASGFAGAPAGLTLGAFPVDGGDLELTAGRDVVAPKASQTTSAWLFRSGASTWVGDLTGSKAAAQTSWSVVYKNFESGVGALGGGDVRVAAGRDVMELEVALPTSGQLTSAVGAGASAADLVVRGGGDLTLRAGRDLLGGLLVLGRGEAGVKAGGRLAGGDLPVALRASVEDGTVLSSTRQVGLLIGLMDATARLEAGSDLLVEGAFDPMLQGQIAENLSQGVGTAFQGSSERAGLTATSASGSILWRNDPWASADLSQRARLADWRVTMTGSGSATLNVLFGQGPATLRLAALSGDVDLTSVFSTLRKVSPPKGRLTLAPAARGTLEVLAQGDLALSLDVQLSDTAPAYRRTALAPLTTARSGLQDQADLAGTLEKPLLRGTAPIHAGDLEPVRLTAVVGTVCADISGVCAPATGVKSNGYATLLSPKPVEVTAGRDVLLGTYQVQNNGAQDVSVIRAGRDVFEVGYEIAGTGAALLLAGRDVVMETLSASNNQVQPSWGGAVRSMGDNTNGAVNTAGYNPALPHDRAADVYVLGGLANGQDLAGFATAYLDPAWREPVTGKAVVRTYLTELGTFLSGLGLGTVPEAERLARFEALPEQLRASFLYRTLFTELKETGIDYNAVGGERYQSYARGFSAIKRIFPGAPAGATAEELPKLGPYTRGDVILGGKPVETWADASIAVLAPWGSLQVGSEVTTGASAALGGVVTRRGGDVQLMANANVDLLTSRVFTLQGGDITMWTSHGSITAGTGSKTSVVSIPLAYTMSSDGVVVVDAFGLQTGSGIGVLDANQGASGRRPSRLDLIAPEGEIDAGDAGIRVVGDINIAAQVVTGLDNIHVTGASSGVPQVDAPNLGAIGTANQVAQSAAQEGVGPSAASKANPLADLPSIVTVEVVGYEAPADGTGTAEEKERKRKATRGK